MASVALLARLWVAWTDQGIIWPDEIYQSLEQAHRLVFGYGFVPWEFRDGARSWFFPVILGGLLKAGSWMGIGTGMGLVLLAKSFMALVGAAAVISTMFV